MDMQAVIDDLTARLGEAAADAAEWVPTGARPVDQAADAVRLVELLLCVAASLARGVGEWIPEAGAISEPGLTWSTYLHSFARRLEAEPLPWLIESLDPSDWPGEPR